MIDSHITKRDGMPARHVIFAAFVFVCIIAFGRVLLLLVGYSLDNESASHIVLIPVISLALLVLERKELFNESPSVSHSVTVVMLSGVAILCGIAPVFFPPSVGTPPSLMTLVWVLLLISGFRACYGAKTTRKALFPLLLLFLTVPLPGDVLQHVIVWLQQGSTAVTYGIFKLVGVPVLRQGFMLTVPGVTIEVASECSGIRSSVALLITCLLAAHLYLRSWPRMLVFVLLVIPLSILKNGVRIATLTLLSVYVDPRFLSGSLHRDGGFVFFFLALLMLWPALLLLHRSENKAVIRQVAAVQESSLA